MAAESEILLEAGTNELEVVEFSLKFPDEHGKMLLQTFGINVAKVREIIRIPQITKLPSQHASILGICTLRDELIPILNLSDWLYNYDALNDKQKLIVAEFNLIKVGFIVHDVNRIHRLSWAQVESPDSVNNMDIENSSVVGIIKLDEKIILMLDIEKILAELNPELGIINMNDNVAKSQQNHNILLAEDSVVIRNMLCDKLHKAGFNITSFHDGLAAWEHLQDTVANVKSAAEVFEIYDLVITDIEMPKMDGYSLTKNIKTHPLLTNLPVIIFSSMITDDARHKGQSIGADAQYAKPQINSIIADIEDIIKKRDEKTEAA
ncbi:MAG: chemotaxis protein CheV [Calditrichaeota bacterium]|nr:MAG: chemotaxis protein CheV [Calditrichota bacterium]